MPIPMINPPAIVKPAPIRTSFSTFKNMVKKHKIETVFVRNNTNDVVWETNEGDVGVSSVVITAPFVDYLIDNNVDVNIEKLEEGRMTNNWITTLPLVIGAYALINYLVSRNNGNSMQMPFMQDGTGEFKLQVTDVTFEDVEGIDEVKEELYELVDFLKNPDKYTNIGASAPKGCLLFGTPGTGKTLLAKAIAGEANVPFLAVSGSQFIELFVGLGASRIRKLFKDARQKSPCIIFIDEIDTIGKTRNQGGLSTGGNDEREQTLNQLLTEMDGFTGSEGVIVIGATNRQDILDPALLRPGRFDRKITVDLPNTEGRLNILKVHSKNKKLDENLNLLEIAKKTPGFSGADLMNLMNEAAIRAANGENMKIVQEDIEYAYEKVSVGLAKNKKLSYETKRVISYHESGHALIGQYFENFDDLTKISILPRGKTGGVTYFTPNEELVDSGMYSKEYLENKICVLLGGHAAEELIFGKNKVTTGASNDFVQATNIARSMITKYGFSEIIGKVHIPDTPENTKNTLVEAEIKNILDMCYSQVLTILKNNKLILDYLADELMNKETMNKSDIIKAFNKKHFIRM